MNERLARVVRCLLVILVLTTRASLQASAQATSLGERKLPLGDSDFQLHAQVLLVRRDSIQIDARFAVSERYSASLSAGRLDLKQRQLGNFLVSTNGGSITSQQVLASFLYSKSLGDKMLLKLSNRLECEATGQAELASHLFGPEMVESASELRDWLALLPGFSDGSKRHVFGLGRLLVFFEQNRDRIKYKAQAKLRNTDIDLFEFSYSSLRGPQDEVDVKLFLPAEKDHQRTVPGYRVPMRALIKFPSRTELVVDFYSVGTIQLDRSSIQDDAASQRLNEVFNFPAGWGCSRFVDKSHVQPEGHLLKSRTGDIYSFEFELSRQMQLGIAVPLQRSFVAYDGVVGALRIEPISGLGMANHELTIYDLNAGLKYNSRGSGHQGGGGKLDGSRDPDVCAAAKLPILEVISFKSILPVERWAEIGFGQVRGIATTIYETTDGQLPPMIFEHTSWLGANKAERNRFDLNDLREEENGLTLVYYVAHHGASRTPSLVRLDVYRDSMHLYRVDLFNFNWRLTGAPNGDSPTELFSMPAQCRPEFDLHLEFSLVLAPAKAESETGSGEADKPEDGRQLVEALRHSPTKHMDLIRGMKALSDSVSVSRLLAISSRVSFEQIAAGQESSIDRQSIKLLTSVRLMPNTKQGGSFLVRAYTIGTGLATGHRQPNENVLTFSECFWEAAKLARPRWSASSDASRQAQLGVVFSFCFSRCWLDPEAKLTRSYTSGTTTSELPKVSSDAFMVSQLAGRKLPCELVLMEQASGPADKSSPMQPSTSEIVLMREIRAQLENNLLSVSVPSHREDSLETSSVTLKVERVELGHGANLEAELTIEGLAFTGATAKVWPIQLEKSDQLETIENFHFAHSSAPEMCHALCVTQPQCRSYSICLSTNQQVACVGSSVDLRDPKLHAQLRLKLDEYNLRSGQRDGKVFLDDKDGDKVEFKVSKRCQLRAKRSTEMFKQLESPPPKAVKMYLDSLRPVANQEQCAELCLNKNVRFFKRLKGVQKELGVTNDDGEMSASEELAQLKRALTKTAEQHDEHMDTMSYWCDKYRYLDRRLTPLTRTIRTQVDGSKEFKGVNIDEHPGLCYLSRGQWASRADLKPTPPGSKPAATISLKMDAYEFLYSALYKRQAGTRLLGLVNQKAKRRTDASKSDSSSTTVSEEVERPADDVGRMENMQMLEKVPPDVEFCARQCFAQAVQWCRSFDLIETDKRFYCIYNSLTREEALKLALKQHLTAPEGSAAPAIEETAPAGSNVHYYHYEPNDAYVLDIVILKLAAAPVLSEEMPREPEHETEVAHYSVWLYLCGIVSGLAVATLVISRWRGSQADSTRRMSQINLARLSFSLPVASANDSSLLSQDQLEIQQDTQDELEGGKLENK